MAKVTFRFLTGLKRNFILSTSLQGSWDSKGNYSSDWCAPILMRPIVAEDGCPAFVADVNLQGGNGQDFRWGVVVTTATRKDIWGIMPEVRDRNSNRRERGFVLGAGDDQVETYYLTQARRLGAQKYFRPEGNSAAQATRDYASLSGAQRQAARSGHGQDVGHRRSGSYPPLGSRDAAEVH